MTQAPLLSAAPRLPWPLPAVLAWGAGWATWQVGLVAGVPTGLAWLLGLACCAGLGLACRGGWRRLLAMLGFPLASLGMGALPGVPAWAWLLLALALLLLYPLGAWRDAPFFPTTRDALLGLSGLHGLPGPAAAPQLLDAGSGLGHGLLALRSEWPRARFNGLERSRVLRLLSSWRCPWADVRGGDMWQASWADHDLVYLFQRPESMARAWAKAQQDMRPGSWLVSLEFPVPGVLPDASLQAAGRKPVWVYRMAPAAAGKQHSTPGASSR
jgi:hypothetical protein